MSSLNDFSSFDPKNPFSHGRKFRRQLRQMGLNLCRMNDYHLSIPKTPSLAIAYSQDDSGKWGAKMTRICRLVRRWTYSSSLTSTKLFSPFNTSSSLDKNSLELTQLAHDSPKAGQTRLPDEYKHPKFPTRSPFNPSSGPTKSTTWFVTTTARPNRFASDFNLLEILKNRDDLRLRSLGVLSNSDLNKAAIESITTSLMGNWVFIWLERETSNWSNTSNSWSAECTGRIKMRSRGL